MTTPQLTLITLDELATYDDLPEELVEIPEWGGKAVRRGLGL